MDKFYSPALSMEGRALREVSSRGIYGQQSDIKTALDQSTSLVSSRPPMLSTHLLIHHRRYIILVTDSKIK
jgi:hypothetical protein